MDLAGAARCVTFCLLCRRISILEEDQVVVVQMINRENAETTLEDATAGVLFERADHWPLETVQSTGSELAHLDGRWMLE